MYELSSEYIQTIKSPKHPGAIFLKMKGTKNNVFICKLYPGKHQEKALHAFMDYRKLRIERDLLLEQNELLKEQAKTIKTAEEVINSLSRWEMFKKFFTGMSAENTPLAPAKRKVRTEKCSQE